MSEVLVDEPAGRGIAGVDEHQPLPGPSDEHREEVRISLPWKAWTVPTRRSSPSRSSALKALSTDSSRASA